MLELLFIHNIFVLKVRQQLKAAIFLEVFKAKQFGARLVSVLICIYISWPIKTTLGVG